MVQPTAAPSLLHFRVHDRHPLCHGKDNHVADALSRASVNAVILEGVDYAAMAASQKNDPDVHAYRTAITGLHQLEDIPFGPNNVTLLCDTSTGRARPIVPTGWRRKVFDLVHGLSHPSVYALRGNSWSTSSCGMVYASRSASGPKPVFLARPPKSRHISEPLWRKLKSLTVGLTTSMWIWWVPFLLHRVSPICLLWWIALPVGQKQFPSPQRTPSHAPTRSLPNGLLALVCLWTFPLIVGRSLHPSCGAPSRSHWEPSFTTPPPTTHRPMALWSGFTAT